MKNLTSLLLYGLLTWIVPFVVAFAFYDQQGQLATSYGLFKCVMTVVSGLTGCIALYRYFGRVDGNFVRIGWLTGLVWLAINLVLDLAVLVPMSGMSLSQYFTTIGLGYLLIPTICVTGGMLLARKTA